MIGVGSSTWSAVRAGTREAVVLPDPPEGYAYVVDGTGRYIVDSIGRYVIRAMVV